MENWWTLWCVWSLCRKPQLSRCERKIQQVVSFCLLLLSCSRQLKILIILFICTVSISDDSASTCFVLFFQLAMWHCDANLQWLSYGVFPSQFGWIPCWFDIEGGIHSPGKCTCKTLIWKNIKGLGRLIMCLNGLFQRTCKWNPRYGMCFF